MSGFCDLSGIIISDLGRQRCNQHQQALHQFLDPRIVGELEQPARQRIDRAVGEHLSVVTGQRLEFVARAGERQFDDGGQVFREQLGKSRFELRPVSTAVPPGASG